MYFDMNTHSNFYQQAGLALLFSLASFLAAPSASADLGADEIVTKVNAVDDGLQLSRKLTMTLTDKRGRSRVRETMAYRKYFGEEKKLVLFYRQPSNVRGTGFLTFDYPEAEKDDDQWLYLPALRKVRRISASDRGDYFLGTDMSYEDMKREGKLEPRDYSYSVVKLEQAEGREAYRMQGIPHSKEIAKELGYGRVEFWVDTSNWVIFKSEFWDVRGKHLKTLKVDGIRQVDNIWTRHIMTVKNHKTGHSTRFEFSEVDYLSPVKDSLFSKSSLKRGR